MKLSTCIKRLEYILKAEGDLDVVELEYADENTLDPYVVTEISPGLITNPNNPKEKLIIFD